MISLAIVHLYVEDISSINSLWCKQTYSSRALRVLRIPSKWSIPTSSTSLSLKVICSSTHVLSLPIVSRHVILHGWVGYQLRMGVCGSAIHRWQEKSCVVQILLLLLQCWTTATYGIHVCRRGNHTWEIVPSFILWLIICNARTHLQSVYSHIIDGYAIENIVLIQTTREHQNSHYCKTILLID